MEHTVKTTFISFVFTLLLTFAAIGQEPAALTVRLTDASTTEAVLARFGFAEQESWQNFTAVSGFTGWGIKHQPWWHAGGEKYVYVEPEFQFNIAAGAYTLIINKGIEYTPVERLIEVSAGETKEISIKLKRWIDLNQRGWYSGDTHLHIARLRSGQNEQVFTLIKAEDLNIAPLVDWAGRAEKPYGPGWGGWVWSPELLRHSAQRDNILIFSAEDWSWPGKSCTLKLLGHKMPVKGKSRYSQAAIIEQVRAEGGIACGSIGVINIEATVIDKLSATELLTIDGFKGLDKWYNLLNTGSHIAAIAGTDVQSNAEPQTIVEHYVPPGADRFYCYIPDGLTKKGVIEAIRKGRTFVTNGPALLLKVNEKLPGSRIAMEDSGSVKVAVELKLPGSAPGELVLIKNGKPVWSQQILAGEPGLDQRFTLNIEDSCWLAAQFTSDKRITGSEIPKAHTSPIYINVAGRGVFVESAYKEIIGQIPPDDVIIGSNATEEEKRIALEYVRSARQKLKERREKAKGGQ